ncbi:MAG TPA: PQQ-dependent sugar dehydrogenase [Patescibacteria group bacterium]
MKTVVGLFFLPSHQNIFEETKLRENRSHKSFFNLKIFLGILCGGLSLLTSLPVSAAGVTLQLPSDYKSTHIISLGNASAFTFDFSIKGSAVSGENSFIIAENLGNAYRVSKIAPDGTAKVLLDRTGQTITNLSYHQGVVYIVTRGRIYKIAKGKISDIITGLPTTGDYGNSTIVFNNGSMYLATGTATNSGIVGADNTWLAANPSVRDIPCANSKLAGVNITTDNFLTAKKDAKATTGSFLPFNTPVSAGQMVYGMSKCNGAVIKSTPDGVLTEVYAWGFHNPKGLSVDDNGNLWLFDGGMENRGVRPIKNGKDALFQVSQNAWYGWPDFSAASPVDQQVILAEFPNNPPQPQAVFDLGLVKYLIISPKTFLTNSALAQVSDEKINRLELSSKSLDDFLSVSGGKIIQYKFGPDDKLYVLVLAAKGKTELYSIESTAPQTSGIIGSTQAKSSFNNWMFGAMLAIFASGGLFAIRNLKTPVKPF